MNTEIKDLQEYKNEILYNHPLERNYTYPTWFLRQFNTDKTYNHKLKKDNIPKKYIHHVAATLTYAYSIQNYEYCITLGDTILTENYKNKKKYLGIQHLQNILDIV